MYLLSEIWNFKHTEEGLRTIKTFTIFFQSVGMAILNYIVINSLNMVTELFISFVMRQSIM